MDTELEGPRAPDVVAKLNSDIALCKDFIRNQSGVEIPTKSPPVGRYRSRAA